MRWKTLAVVLPAVLLLDSAVAAVDLSEIRALIEEGQPTQALVRLAEYLEKSPADPEAMFLRGRLLAEARREGRAMEIFEEVSNLRPDRPEPLNNLAVIQAAKGDYEAAVETLKEALRTHPAYRTAYENLTKIYGQLASEAYSRALNVDQAHARSSVELVLLNDMVLPETAEVQIAKAESTENPAEPMPVAVAEAKADMPMTEPVPLDEPMEAAEAEASMATQNEAAAELAVASDDAGQPVVEPSEPAQTDEPGPVSKDIELADLAHLVEAWARAWSEQRVEDYLYFYGLDFSPAGEMGREAWEAQRRERVSRPDFVKVSVAFLDFEAGDSVRALVRFNQSYESDTFSDVVTKTLELVRESGEWKIVKETVDS